MKAFLLIALWSTIAFCCKFEGTQRGNGEIWVIRKSFVMKCLINKDLSWKTEVIGCQSPLGAEIPVDGFLKENGMKYSCKREENGRLSYHSEMDAITFCDGHQLGETWLVNKNFNRSCTKEGSFILNCLTDMGTRIELNGQIVEQGTLYKCTQEPSGTVFLHRGSAPIDHKLNPLKAILFKEGNLETTTTPASTTIFLATKPETTTVVSLDNSEAEFTFTEPPPTATTELTETTPSLEDQPTLIPQNDEEMAVTQIHPTEPAPGPAPPAPLPINDSNDSNNFASLSNPPSISSIRPMKHDEGPAAPPAEAEAEPEQLIVSPSGIVHEQAFSTESAQTVTSQPIHIVHPPSIRPPKGFMRLHNNDVQCVEDGVVREAEETWIADEKFRKKCTSQGAIIVLECLIDENTTIAVNSDRRIGDRLYRCWRRNQQVFYEMKDASRWFH